MIPREILKKVRRIEIATRGMVNDVFAGQYHSVFKGRGMDFAEVREYQIGDDIRNIDWNVTARVGSPYVKIYQEERELTVMLVVDVSASGDFGTMERMKGEIGAEICALLAFSAIKNNDKVGLIIFSDRIEKFVPPRKGRSHALRVLRELLYFEPEGRGTNVGQALEYLTRVIPRRAIVFLVSDFLSTGYERPLSVAGRRHDVVAIQIADRRETEIPPIGYVELEDAETGDHLLVDTSDIRFRNRWRDLTEQFQEAQEKTFKSTKVDFIRVTTDSAYIGPLARFFHQRARPW